MVVSLGIALAPKVLIEGSTCKPELVQEMDSHDSKNWQKANWSNGDPFNTTWQPDNVTFNNGVMTLTLDNKGCPQKCDNKPYASGEYRTTREKYRYGLYEARIKPAKGNGLVAGYDRSQRS